MKPGYRIIGLICFSLATAGCSSEFGPLNQAKVSTRAPSGLAMPMMAMAVNSPGTLLANEDQTFIVASGSVVAYGANSIYVQKTVSGTGTCSNSTFGDPIVGVVKACYLVSGGTTSAPSGSPGTFLANENQTFTVASGSVVAYGANSVFIQAPRSGTGTCSNAAFGKDPIVGVVKACYLVSGSTPSAPAPSSGTPGTFLADENQTFTVASGSVVAYGANSVYVQAPLSGTGTCSNAAFGKDPIVGVVKACYLVSGSADSTPTTPVVNPPPPSTTTDFAYCGPEDRMFPANAAVLPVSQKAQLQTFLDTNKIVVLTPGDYSGVSITLKSGQQLYGIPGKTTISQVKIEPGTTGAVLKGLMLSSDGNLTFPPSNMVTQKNCFTMMQANVVAVGATLDSNVFQAFYGGININTLNGGYAKHNRFTRFITQAAGCCGSGAGLPAINLIGDTGFKSYDNTFMFTNMLTPISSPVVVQNQDDVSFIASANEDYDTSASGYAGIYVRNVNSFKGFYIEGGAPYGFLDIGAKDFTLVGGVNYGDISGHNNPAANPGFILRSNNQRALWLNIALHKFLSDENPSGLRLHTDIGSSEGSVAVGNARSNGLSGAQATSAADFLANDNAASTPWTLPSLGAIPDPGGATWNSNLAAKPDDAPTLQALLNADTTGIVQLQAKTYYIGSPLYLKANQFLIGAGADKTLIVAKSPTVNMIATNWKTAGNTTTGAFGLMDLTLQGGNTGMSFAEAGTQVSVFYISHVTIRDMTEAGIYLNNLYAWDNGYVEYLNIVNSNTGFKQRGTGVTATEGTIAYMDKVLFYRNQFLNNNIDIDLDPARQNNMNMWFESTFTNSKTQVTRMNGSAATMFVSSKFINNAGNPAIFNHYAMHYIMNSYFEAGPSTVSMIGRTAVCEGCTFNRGTSTKATILATINDINTLDGRPVFLINSSSSNMPLGGGLGTSASLYSLTSVNSSFTSTDAIWTAPWSNFFYNTMGTIQTSDDTFVNQSPWLPGATKPGSKFLRSRN